MQALWGTLSIDAKRGAESQDVESDDDDRESESDESEEVRQESIRYKFITGDYEEDFSDLRVIWTLFSLARIDRREDANKRFVSQIEDILSTEPSAVTIKVTYFSKSVSIDGPTPVRRTREFPANIHYVRNKPAIAVDVNDDYSHAEIAVFFDDNKASYFFKEWLQGEYFTLVLTPDTPTFQNETDSLLFELILPAK